MQGFRSRPHFLFRLSWVIALLSFGIAGCGSGGGESASLGSSSLPIQAVPFTQSDLTGTWDFYHFQASTSTGLTGSGWFRVVVRFDGSGVKIVDDNTTWQGGGAFARIPAPRNGSTENTWTVDSYGVVTETGGSTSSTFHGNMASNRQLIVATADMLGGDRAIRILRKRVPGVTFSSSDLYGKSLAYHMLGAGTTNSWDRGDGTVDGSGMINGHWFLSDGSSGTNGPMGPVAIDAGGVVTLGDDSSFKGVMTADKNIIFATLTNGSEYRFMVITISGQTFAQSDLAGTWRTQELASGADVSRSHATIAIDSTGAGTWSDMVRTDNTTPGPFNLTMNSSGEMQNPSAPAWMMWHGSMSNGKDFICVTYSDSDSAPDYWISLAVKSSAAVPAGYYEIYGAQAGDYDLTTGGRQLIGNSSSGNTFNVTGYARFILYVPSTSSTIRFDAIGLDSNWVNSTGDIEYTHYTWNINPTGSTWASGDSCIEGPPDGITMENTPGYAGYYGFTTMGASLLTVYTTN